MNKEKLLKLASFLDELPEHRFFYGSWVGSTWGGKEDLSCGTTACALGWAATIPEFREEGLRLKRTHGGLAYISLPRGNGYGDYEDTEAGSVFFEIDRAEAYHLFQPNDALGNHVSPGSTASAQDVAAHIRWFVDVKERAEHDGKDLRSFLLAQSVPALRSGRAEGGGV